METERDKHVFLHQNSGECFRNKNKQVKGDICYIQSGSGGTVLLLTEVRGGEEAGRENMR